MLVRHQTFRPLALARTAAMLGLALCVLPGPALAAPAAGPPAPAASGAVPNAAAPNPAIAGAPAKPAPNAAAADPNATAIVAVVNGSVISRADLDNRRKLFAMSTGMPASVDVLNRLTPQVIHQLIDEKLRLQEVQKRKIVVSDQDIALAIGDVEQRNSMPAGALRQRLAADGVELRTLIDQIRVQLGWTRVLRQVLAGATEVSDADIAEKTNLLKAQIGQPEFHLAEIFVPVTDPALADEAKRFADTVIQQLRLGASFTVVAAQFSQSQTALQGGDLGWEQPNQLDPEVLRIVKEMPVGAVSNPIHVAGGYSIVQMRGRREIGRDPATMIRVRQVFYAFSTPLNPTAPTDQQRKALETAKALSTNAKSCDDIDAASKLIPNSKAADPGEVRLEGISSPALRNVLANLAVGKASQPLVAEDGIAVLMVCSREEKNLGIPTRQELTDKIISERVETASRQLQRDLQRRAVIDQRS